MSNVEGRVIEQDETTILQKVFSLSPFTVQSGVVVGI
jgi:hypothetical protein